MRYLILLLPTLLLFGCDRGGVDKTDRVSELEKEMFPRQPPDDYMWDLETFFWAHNEHMAATDDAGGYTSGTVQDNEERIVCYKVVDTSGDDQPMAFSLEHVEEGATAEAEMIMENDEEVSGFRRIWCDTGNFRVNWKGCNWGVAVYRPKKEYEDPNARFLKRPLTEAEKQQIGE